MPTNADRQQRTAAPLRSLATRVVRRNGVGNVNVLTISGRHGLVSQAEYFNKRVASAALDGYYLIHRGEYAYNKSHSTGYPVGAIKRLDRYDAGVVSPLYICFGVTRPDVVDSDYLAHYFEGGMLEDQLRGIAAQGARDHGLLNVKPDDFLGLSVELPPLAEQRKIAAILSSVDDTIEKTEAVIAQLQVVKKAMMQELLTRGMPGRHTRFKQTEIGAIPEAWDLVPLEGIATVERGKFTHRPRNDPAYFGGQYPYIQTGDVAACDGRIEHFTQTLSELGLAASRIFPAGTIVITIAANIGDTGIATFDVAFPDSLVGIIAGSRVSNAFLELVLRSRKAELDAAAPQNAQKNINLQVLRPLAVQLPCLAEQIEIAECIDSVERRRRTEGLALSHLRSAKAALSAALLSGDLRVTAVKAAP